MSTGTPPANPFADLVDFTRRVWKEVVGGALRSPDAPPADARLALLGVELERLRLACLAAARRTGLPLGAVERRVDALAGWCTRVLLLPLLRPWEYEPWEEWGVSAVTAWSRPLRRVEALAAQLGDTADAPPAWLDELPRIPRAAAQAILDRGLDADVREVAAEVYPREGYGAVRGRLDNALGRLGRHVNQHGWSLVRGKGRATLVPPGREEST